MTTPMKVEEYLNTVNYTVDPGYVPSDFALEFVTFIKLVNGQQGEEHKTPLVHYFMLDTLTNNGKRVINLCHRGIAKTTLMGEYLFLYIATYGEIPGFGRIDLALYVSDSIENGIKNMRKNLEFRWENSDFLKQYIPNVRFTDIRWEFINADGKVFVVKGYGAKTGVRGAKEMGKRPQLAVLDDLISDEDARSVTVISAVEDTVYKAVNYALHPSKNMIIWSGTPFNAKDPLYKAVESGAWEVNVFPVCEQFPCSKEEFKGSWPDRFTYEYVKEQYDSAMKLGKIETFNQELGLRIMSDEDRMIQDSDIGWYKLDSVVKNKNRFNFYITTDFATSEKQKSDFSVISVWAYNNAGDWLWVDGICKRQLMDKNIDDLFRLAQLYKPQSVGIEVTGQQGGFIQWIQGQMLERNIYFPLASEGNDMKPGIRPNTNKLVRFNTVVPWFKAHKIYFPAERKTEATMQECINELSLASVSGFRSKHDDFCFEAGTQILLEDGSSKGIEYIACGDRVLSHDGIDIVSISADKAIMTGVNVVNDYVFSDGSVIAMTPNHPILTTQGWVHAAALTQNHIILSVIQCKSVLSTSNGQKSQTATTNLLPLFKESVDGYTNGLGNNDTGSNLKAPLFTIKTMIKKITQSTIWSYLHGVNTKNTMDSRAISPHNRSIWRVSENKQQSGISPILVESGIKKIMLKLRGLFTQKHINTPVNSVGDCLCPTLKNGPCSVVPLAPVGLISAMSVNTKNTNVPFVGIHLNGLRENKPALKSVYPLSLVEIKRGSRVVPTYNFEVPGTHTYILAVNGVIAHNCDTISMLSSLMPWKPSEEAPMKEDNAGSGMWDIDITPEAADRMASYIV